MKYITKLFSTSFAMCVTLLFTAESHALDFGTFIRDFAASEVERLDREKMGLDQRWDKAHFVRQNRTGDYSIQNCSYKTTGGFDFSINIRKSTCPYRVYINIESGQVRIP
jgi:hypothetical protein